MLSLPQCASSTFGPSQEEFNEGVVEPETKDHSSLKSSMSPSDESDCSSASRDPTSHLGPWRDIVQGEPRAAFRHALASLIVAKNENRDPNENGLLWLPSILEENFHIEQNHR